MGSAMKTEFKLTNHAIKRFEERAEFLGFKYENPEKIVLYFLKKAKKEKPNNTKTKWELFRRSILRGNVETYVYKGWRFVVDPKSKTVLTVERQKPHENYPSSYRRWD